MKLSHAMTPNQVVLRLQSGYRAAADCGESLEEIRDRLRALFDAVSDAVLLYQSGEVRLQNENACRLLDSFGEEREAMKAELYRHSAQVLRGLPVTVRREIGGRDRVLAVHSAKALRLEEGNALLVTVVDLSEAMEHTTNLEKASSEERRRIARDLHDGLSQLLASLLFQSQALAIKTSGNSAGKRYARIAALALVCARKGRQLHREFYETCLAD